VTGSTEPKRVSKDTTHKGYISLFTDEDCIRLMLYVPRDRDNTCATKKPFWTIQRLDQRRQDPKTTTKESTMATSVNASIQRIVPLGLLHTSVGWSIKVVDISFLKVPLHTPHAAIITLEEKKIVLDKRIPSYYYKNIITHVNFLDLCCRMPTFASRLGCSSNGLGCIGHHETRYPISYLDL
jgi:hypothetical protein